MCIVQVGTIYAFNQHYMIDVHPNHTARAPDDSTPLHHIMYQLKDPHHFFTDTPGQTDRGREQPLSGRFIISLHAVLVVNVSSCR